MKVYKTVSGPKIIEVKSGKENKAFELFSDMINKEAKSGWTFHSLETIAVKSNPGCALLKNYAETVNHHMLIFEKEVANELYE